ncbi:MAG: enoyl-CoA hydratase/isomerase family protein [Rhodobacterales bacterium]|nr:enoyl-CoA hydratase/isomerase family protein [Rhodobacterales bacterium]
MRPGPARRRLAVADYEDIRPEDIRVETPGPHIRLITLNRPRVRNALRTRLLEEVAAVLRDAATDDDVRAVVLTGGPDVFAAGADITEMEAHDAVTIQNDPRVMHWKMIRAFPKPLIAAVNGYALGGGNELAMHADIIIAGDTAQFGQPEVNLGIIPGAGGTQRLTRVVGKSVAMKLCLSGAFMDAQEALARGLVAEVVPADQTLDRALALAATIAKKAPKAVQLAKVAVLKSYQLGLNEALAFERDAFCSLFATEDRLEGIAAFREKRKPVFKGR